MMLLMWIFCPQMTLHDIPDLRVFCPQFTDRVKVVARKEAGRQKPFQVQDSLSLFESSTHRL